ncbi:hypothetical protein Gasu2_62550 [Galdieria sulphuraria]|uniref:Uncharacterized protein n=1 Tax=Galdieria sulphuraria TaxID=130081 RepID=M2WVU2_GALSU|nr:uncharacterized protein Gasu_44430 [Galdieria sulphuraria]EME28110.1 hypothetical protein Gasu_44430 [Galdieria sulphuraria]GJD12143.1 hypothetical protein Gasu2_62550 [Galdieria sulphuraria]|eukprot:XP_005704630.1 hypothetical protein Gasu_44430 [Galdieria sulphuraria]
MSGNAQDFKQKLEKQILAGRSDAQKKPDSAPEEWVVNEPKRITKPQTEAQKKLADLLKSSVPSKERVSDK